MTFSKVGKGYIHLKSYLIYQIINIRRSFIIKLLFQQQLLRLPQLLLLRSRARQL